MVYRCYKLKLYLLVNTMNKYILETLNNNNLCFLLKLDFNKDLKLIYLIIYY